MLGLILMVAYARPAINHAMHVLLLPVVFSNSKVIRAFPVTTYLTMLTMGLCESNRLRSKVTKVRSSPANSMTNVPEPRMHAAVIKFRPNLEELERHLKEMCIKG